MGSRVIRVMGFLLSVLNLGSGTGQTDRQTKAINPLRLHYGGCGIIIFPVVNTVCMLPTCVMITRQPPVLRSPVDRSVPLTCDLITIGLPIKVKMQVPWDDSASLLTVLQFFGWRN